MNPLRLIFALRSAADYVSGAGFKNDDLRSVPAGAVVLSLEGAEIDDDGISGLPMLHFLRCLDLDGTKITDRSLAAVAGFPKLEELWLECTTVTDVGLKALHRATSLKFVSVAYTGVTQAGLAALVAAIPGVEVSA